MFDNFFLLFLFIIFYYFMMLRIIIGTLKVNSIIFTDVSLEKRQKEMHITNAIFIKNCILSNIFICEISES